MIEGDLVNMYKTFNDSDFFTLTNYLRTRGNDKTLKNGNWNKDIKRHSFAHRSLKEWNKLPDSVISSESLNCFKSKLDNNWGET